MRYECAHVVVTIVKLIPAFARQVRDQILKLKAVKDPQEGITA